jgi:hypothetical protein
LKAGLTWFQPLTRGGGSVREVEGEARASDSGNLGTSQLSQKNDIGHVLVSRSSANCAFIAGARPSATDCHYSGIDRYLFDGERFRCEDRTPIA